jgi:hypothetical protein
VENSNEILAMLALIYKKLDELERKVKGSGSSRFMSLQSYLDELRSEARGVSVR